METTGKQQEERNGANGEKMKMSQSKDADKILDGLVQFLFCSHQLPRRMT